MSAQSQTAGATQNNKPMPAATKPPNYRPHLGAVIRLRLPFIAAIAMLHRRCGSRSPRLAASTYPLGDYLADKLGQIVVLKLGAGGVECLAHNASNGVVEKRTYRPERIAKLTPRDPPTRVSPTASTLTLRPGRICSERNGIQISPVVPNQSYLNANL